MAEMTIEIPRCDLPAWMLETGPHGGGNWRATGCNVDSDTITLTETQIAVGLVRAVREMNEARHRLDSLRLFTQALGMEYDFLRQTVD